MSLHRNGSGLTSLARQLSVELEELNARFDPTEGTPLELSPDGSLFYPNHKAVGRFGTWVRHR